MNAQNVILAGLVFIAALSVIGGRGDDMVRDPLSTNTKGHRCPGKPRKSSIGFDGCSHHFVHGIPPAVPGGSHIELCHDSWYASAYNTTLRMPIYSAYRVTAAQASAGMKNKFPRPSWSHTSAIPVDSQAACHNSLWSGKSGAFDRGHLCPKDIMEFDVRASDSTFDLTNAVPQLDSCNSPTWSKIERAVALQAEHRGPLYVVTGVAHEATVSYRDGVPTPLYIWTAFCNPVDGQSGAFIGKAAEHHCGGDAHRLRPVREVEALLHGFVFPEKACNTARVSATYLAKATSHLGR